MRNRNIMAGFNILQLFLLSLTFYTIQANLFFRGKYNLKSVNMVFRHGDRTPDADTLPYYLTDPYRNYTYEPMGYGALTNNGKLRMYNFGKSLRERYDAFLGSTYRPKDVTVRTTWISRTKVSALLVLAGLYPPNKEQHFSDELPNWQPIPLKYGPIGVDPIASFLDCPMYVTELKRVKKTIGFETEEYLFTRLIQNASHYIGREIDNIQPLIKLYEHLSSQYWMNLTLPAWTKAYYPNGRLNDVALFGIRTFNFNRQLIKLGGGIIMRKMFNNMLAIVEGRKGPHPKINLISAHDVTVAGILHILYLWNSVVPQYSSAVILELYERNKEYYVRILHYKGIPAEYEVLRLPGCWEYCSFELFVDFIEDSMPDDIIEACFGPVNKSLLIPKNMDPIQWIYNNFKKWLD